MVEAVRELLKFPVVPAVKALAEHTSVVGIVTQPDRPAGRGQVLTPPAVKVFALEQDIPFIQPAKLRLPENFDRLAQWAPDLIVVAAYGQILRPNVLDLPRFGTINVHASLLPRWRGAAPIQAAILHGDPITGVTIMKMDPGIDTGPILAQRPVQILTDDTTATLSPRLSRVGADLLVETLPDYLNGEIQPRPQDSNQATYAPLLKKENARLDFSQNADILARQVRAYFPWPGSFTLWQDQPLKVLKARDSYSTLLDPGQTGIVEGLPAIGAQCGVLLLEEVQPAGKKPQKGNVFLQGARGWGKDSL
jgi:methionyl-tRNA formyltransferase